jgi:hypothetical protein
MTTVYLASHSLLDRLVTIYISLFITFITSKALSLHTLSTKRSPVRLELDDPCPPSYNEIYNNALAHDRIPHERFLGTTLKPTIPVALIGTLHLGLFAGFHISPVAINAVFFSLTVRERFSTLPHYSLILKMINSGPRATEHFPADIGTQHR